METFLYYLLRVTIVTMSLYGFYKLLFSKTTFYTTNRVALILVLTTIVLLPLFRFQLLPEPNEVLRPLEINTLELSYLSVVEEHSPFTFIIPWVKLFSIIYFVGLAFFFFRYIIGIFQLIVMIKKSDREAIEDDSVLCISHKPTEPFSWWKYIVIFQNDYTVENNAILDHERAHVNFNHSADRLFFDLFACVFWFNPFAWLLRRELQSVHEFQADERVLENGIDAKKYQLLLIRKSVGEAKFALANNFLQRDLHKRITMMMKNKSNSRLKWGYVIVIPIIAVTIIVLSIPKLNASVSNRQVVDKSDVYLSNEKLITTDKPIDLTKRPLELSGTQIVNKDSVKIIIHEDADKSNPTDMDSVIVIMDSVIVIDHGKKDETNRIEVRGISTKYGENPLYIVDEVEMEEGIDHLNRDDIESVSVMKDKFAMEVFGEKGKNGVIIITTKKPEKKVKLNTNDLLIIVDDKVMPADFNLSSINPDEIESVSVLKDVSAVDIYGEKGQNGVIIIKKKIKEDK